MAPTQLSIVLERLLNELGIANLSMFEAVLMHDTGAVLDAIRSTAAAAEAGVAAYASSATSNVVVSPSSGRLHGKAYGPCRKPFPSKQGYTMTL